MKTALAALIVGYGLDLLLGDPSFLYHPIRVIGNLIALLEKWLRKVFPKTPKGELAGGVFLVILVCLVCFCHQHDVMALHGIAYIGVTE